MQWDAIFGENFDTQHIFVESNWVCKKYPRLKIIWLFGGWFDEELSRNTNMESKESLLTLSYHESCEWLLRVFCQDQLQTKQCWKDLNGLLIFFNTSLSSHICMFIKQL